MAWCTGAPHYMIYLQRCISSSCLRQYTFLITPSTDTLSTSPSFTLISNNRKHDCSAYVSDHSLRQQVIWLKVLQPVTVTARTGCMQSVPRPTAMCFLTQTVPNPTHNAAVYPWNWIFQTSVNLVFVKSAVDEPLALLLALRAAERTGRDEGRKWRPIAAGEGVSCEGG